MKRLSDGGFGILQTLCAVLVVLVIVSISWLAYQHNKTRTADAATGSTNVTSQQKASENTNTSQTSPVVGYLDIKEWGVKVPLSKPIQDAYYVVSSGSADSITHEPNTMWLGLTSLTGDCNATRANTPGASTISALGALGRALPTDTEPVKGVLYTKLYPGTVIGKYYYFYIGNSSDKTCTSQATLQSIDSVFTNAAKSIVPMAN